MKAKFVVSLMLALLMLSAVQLATVNAVFPAGFPNLPSTVVQFSVSATYGTESYFIGSLSGVPVATPPYDVWNSPPTYLTWCDNVLSEMPKDKLFDVMLYSSLSPPAPYDTINWIAINYILNHKGAATVQEIQYAIWYFTNPDWYANYGDSIGQGLITAANSNPNWDPSTGTVLAILCVPTPAIQTSTGQTTILQPTFIEIPTPPEEGPPGFTPGFWKHNIGVYLTSIHYDDVDVNGKYSAFEGGPLDGVKLTDAMIMSIGTNAELYQIYRNLCPQLDGITADIRADAANALNAFFGYGPFVEE